MLLEWFFDTKPVTTFELMVELRDVKLYKGDSIGAMRLVKAELAINFSIMDCGMHNQRQLAYKQDQCQQDNSIAQGVFHLKVKYE